MLRSKSNSKIKCYGDMCRLCGESGKVLMTNIFDDSLQVLENIHLVVPMPIDQHDQLPKKICSVCLKELSRAADLVKKALNTHERLKSSSPVGEPCENDFLPLNGPIVCDVCDVEFVNMVKFDKHIEEHKEYFDTQKLVTDENDSVLWICSDCGFAYRDDETYQMHRTKRGRPCLKCKVVFFSDCTYLRHVCKKVEKRVEMVVQESSPRVAIPKLAPEQVIKDVQTKFHSNSFVCEVCNKILTTKVSLDIHRRIHFNEKPYICEHCGKSFRSKANLNQHIVIHTGSKKHSCPVCNKRFSRKSFVKLHMRVHTGEKPYACEICGYRFTQMGDKRRHVARHMKQKQLRQILPFDKGVPSEEDIIFSDEDVEIIQVNS